MKRVFLIVVILCFSNYANAQVNSIIQDTVILKNGEEIICKIKEVNDRYIICNSTDTDSVSDRIIPKESISILKYSNGKSEVITTYAPIVNDENAYFMFKQGQTDAKRYFRAKGVFLGSFGSTLIYPPLGIPTTVVFACINPKIKNFKTPNSNFLNDENYLKGYKNGAKKKKLSRSIRGFSAAIGVWVGIIIVLFASTPQLQ